MNILTGILIGSVIGSVIGYIIAKLILFILNLIDDKLSEICHGLEWKEREREMQWHIQQGHAFDFESMLWRKVK